MLSISSAMVISSSPCTLMTLHTVYPCHPLSRNVEQVQSCHGQQHEEGERAARCRRQWGGCIRGWLGLYCRQLTCQVPTLHQYHVYPWVYPSMGTPMGDFCWFLHCYPYPQTHTHIITCFCTAGKGYPMGMGVGCTLETHGFTCALA